MSEVYKNALEATKSVSGIIENIPSLNEITKMSLAIAKTVKGIESSPLIKEFKRFQESVQNIIQPVFEKIRLNNELNNKLNELKIPYSPCLNNFFDDLNTTENVEQFLEKKIDSKFLINEFNQIECNEYQKRQHIIRSCIEGYEKGLYNLVVPTLYTQIEGVFLVYIEESEDYRGSINKKRHSEEFKDRYDNNYKVLDMGLEKFIFNEVFKSGKKSGTRHTVLHGKDIDYGTQMNCIRLFLVLHILFLLEEQKN